MPKDGNAGHGTSCNSLFVEIMFTKGDAEALMFQKSAESTARWRKSRSGSFYRQGSRG